MRTLRLLVNYSFADAKVLLFSEIAKFIQGIIIFYNAIKGSKGISANKESHAAVSDRGGKPCEKKY